MRLLNTKTLQLESFNHNAVPRYAILSHTWETEEVLFEEIQNLSNAIQQKEGFKKIKQFCNLAAEEGYDYGWVDTCNIDKTSSAELSEAINSMYKWYKNSDVCYVYLSDIRLPAHTGSDKPDLTADQVRGLATARWFSRGFTLQELIAPSVVMFFDADWNFIASKRDLAQTISDITQIDVAALLGRPPSHYTVAERMIWASTRSTTRVEDEAYCLLGIFDINIPLLYGEGRRAFFRLQAEIITTYSDLSMLLWTDNRNAGSVFARSPSFFNRVPQFMCDQKLEHHHLEMHFLALNIPHIQLHQADLEHPPTLSSRGLLLNCYMIRNSQENIMSIFLNCIVQQALVFLDIIPCQPTGSYKRSPKSPTIRFIPLDELLLATTTLAIDRIYLKDRDDSPVYTAPDIVTRKFPGRKYLERSVFVPIFNGQIPPWHALIDVASRPCIQAVFKVAQHYVIPGIFFDTTPWVVVVPIEDRNRSPEKDLIPYLNAIEILLATNGQCSLPDIKEKLLGFSPITETNSADNHHSVIARVDRKVPNWFEMQAGALKTLHTDVSRHKYVFVIYIDVKDRTSDGLAEDQKLSSYRSYKEDGLTIHLVKGVGVDSIIKEMKINSDESEAEDDGPLEKRWTSGSYYEIEMDQ